TRPHQCCVRGADDRVSMHQRPCARRKGSRVESHSDHRGSYDERRHYDVVQRVPDRNREHLVDLHRHCRSRDDAELHGGPTLSIVVARMELLMKFPKSLSLVAALSVFFATPALCQQPASPVSGLQRGYVTAVGGAAFGAETTTMLAAEYGDTVLHN